MRLALFEPDIAQNTGTILRLAACLGVGVDLIEPAGFPIGSHAMRRAGMDYLDHVEMRRHSSFAAFAGWLAGETNARLVLLTTSAARPYTEFTFQDGDILLLGRESAGVPPEVHRRADARIRIPMRDGMRSLNVAVTAAMALGEGLRQTGLFPPDAPRSASP